MFGRRLASTRSFENEAVVGRTSASQIDVLFCVAHRCRLHIEFTRLHGEASDSLCLECGSPTEWCCAEQRIISFSVVVRVLRRLVWWSITGRTQTCDRVPNAFGTRCNPSPRARSPCGTHMFSGEWTLQQHVCVNLSLVGMALLSGVCVCVVMESGLASQWLRQMEKMAETHIAHGVLSDVVVCLRPIRDPCRTPCIGCGAWST